MMLNTNLRLDWDALLAKAMNKETSSNLLVRFRLLALDALPALPVRSRLDQSTRREGDENRGASSETRPLTIGSDVYVLRRGKRQDADLQVR